MLTLFTAVGVSIGATIARPSNGVFDIREFLTWFLVIVLLLALWAGYRLQKQLDNLRDNLLYNLEIAEEVHFGRDPGPTGGTNIQFGVRLNNFAAIPIRYDVREMTVVVGSRTSPDPVVKMRHRTIPSGRQSLFLFPPIPDIPSNEFPAKARIEYRIAYGPALSLRYTHELKETLSFDKVTPNEAGLYLFEVSEHLRL